MSESLATIINATYLIKLFDVDHTKAVDVVKLNPSKVIDTINLISQIGPNIRLISTCEKNAEPVIIATQLFIAISDYMMMRVKRVISDNMTDDLSVVELDFSYSVIKKFVHSLTNIHEKISIKTIAMDLADIYYMMDYLVIDGKIIGKITDQLIKDAKNKNIDHRFYPLSYAMIKYKLKGMRLNPNCSRYLDSIGNFISNKMKRVCIDVNFVANTKSLDLILFMSKKTRQVIVDSIKLFFIEFKAFGKWKEISSKLIKVLAKKLMKIHKFYTRPVQKIATHLFQTIEWQDLSYDDVIKPLQQLTEATDYHLPTDMAKKLHLRKCLENGVKHLHGYNLQGFYVDSPKTIETFGLNYSFESEKKINLVFVSHILTTSANPESVELSVKNLDTERKYQGKVIINRSFSIRMKPIGSVHTGPTHAIRACFSYIADDGEVKYLWWVFRPIVKKIKQQIKISNRHSETITVKKEIISTFVVKTFALKIQFHSVEIIVMID